MNHATGITGNPAWRIALAGMVSLAVAMGIGRFAFTPLLPMMLSDGVIDLATSSWLASANYLGYLVGALLCTFQPLAAGFLSRSSSVEAGFSAALGVATAALLVGALMFGAMVHRYPAYPVYAVQGR